MDLKAHYEALFQSSLDKVTNDAYEIDAQIHNPNDSRRGLTLLARPDQETQNRMLSFLDRLKIVEPAQYYYPINDLHITVMSLISCYPGFDLEQINTSSYVDTVNKSLKGITAFQISFNGVTLSPAGVLFKGFPEDQSLHQLRNQLREEFKKTDLQQSLDKRYKLETAHTTAMRFAAPLQQKEQFIHIINKHLNTPFGKITIQHLELVYNDWYQRTDIVKSLHQFTLPEIE
ncbi:hypothetical protein GCM10028791_20290 [Echinicola sediminis]